jgi:uncharacterized protein YdaU (DUF1376 family)
MHYFQFNIKEWISNTAHLSLEEEAAYLRLIFYYYDSEKPIADDDLAMVFRKCRMTEQLGKAILIEFFDLDNGGWVHNRCDKEIIAYQGKREQASRAGKASAERRFNGRSTDVQPTINKEQLTINNKQKKEIEPPVGVSDSVWNDFVAMRKTKRAPISATALKGLQREANKAGIPLEDVMSICCERGWIGFKADWIKDDWRKSNTNNSPQLAAARTIFGDERGFSNAIKTIT